MTPRKKVPASAGAWSETVGLLPHKVTVEERVTRNRALYVRSWDSAISNWRWKSLARALDNAGFGATSLRDANGIVIPAVADWAIQQAWKQYRVIAGLAPSDDVAGLPAAAPLTIGATWPILSNKDTGLYPEVTRDGRVVLTGHVREVKRALAFASLVWGENTAWAVIGRADMTKLMRRRMESLLAGGHSALRSTEITITRILAVAQWLRDELHIPMTAAQFKKSWRDDLRKDWKTLSGKRVLPVTHQPRYTTEESRAMLDAAWGVDPRAGLLLALGAEYRLGQVRLATRRDLALEATADAPCGAFTIHGAGKKQGEVVYLTQGQRRSVDRALSGYLAPLEAQYAAGSRSDYPIFPGGRLADRQKEAPRLAAKMSLTRPVHRDWVAKTLRVVEDAARVQMPDGTERAIEHVRGRLAYGIRRENVDSALASHMSDEALRATGGWKTTEVPRGTYADKSNTIGRKEAAAARAERRGET